MPAKIPRSEKSGSDTSGSGTSGSGTTGSRAPAPPNRPAAAWIFLVLLTFSWGAMWPGVKLAIAEIPIFSFRALTIVGGLGIIMAGAVMAGQSLRPERGEFWKIAVTGFFQITVWLALSTIALIHLPAGRASLLAYTMPLWAMLISLVFLKEKPTTRRLIGVFLGVSAILLLTFDAWTGGLDGSRALGFGVILAASITWAIGATLQKHMNFKTPIAVNLSWQLIFAAPWFIALGVYLEPQDWIETVSSTALLATAIVTIASLAGGLYFWAMILKLTDVGFASIAILTVPVTALILSVIALGEPLGLIEIGGLALLLLGLSTVIPQKNHR